MSYNKLIKFKTKAIFDAQVKNLPATSIVFIEDIGQLWTHGKFYGGSNGGDHNHNGIYLPINGTAKAAEKLASITTSFNGKYPVTVNVNGIIYSHAGLQFEGSTGTLTATKFKGILEGNASSSTTSKYQEVIDISGFVGKTVLEAKNQIKTIISQNANKGLFILNLNSFGEALINNWNNDSFVLTAGNTYLFAEVTCALSSPYAFVKFTTYGSKKIWTSALVNNSWGSIHKIMHTDDTAVDSSKLGGILASNYYHSGNSNKLTINWAANRMNANSFVGTDLALSGNALIQNNQVWHAGNSNKSDVDWRCRSLAAALTLIAGYGTDKGLRIGSDTDNFRIHREDTKTVFTHKEDDVDGANGWGYFDFFVNSPKSNGKTRFLLRDRDSSSLLKILDNGNVGINNPTPTEKLHVVGNGKFSENLTALKFIGPLQGNADTVTNGVYTNTAQNIIAKKTFTVQQAFSVAQGTSPFTVTSNTKVTNLNADLLDGLDSNSFNRFVSIGNTSHDYTNFVILLCELTNTDISANYFCGGTIHLKRSNTLSNQIQKIDVYVGKNYNQELPVFILKATNSLNKPKPVIVTYNGVKYAALDFTITASSYDAGGYFYGNASNLGIIQGIRYKNNKTSEILNSEINNSITKATSYLGTTFYGTPQVTIDGENFHNIWSAQNFNPDLKANLASPSFTGTPTAPTAAPKTNTTQIATTAFVRKEVSDLVGGAPETLDTLKEISDYLTNGSVAGGIVDQLSKKVNKTGDTMSGALSFSAPGTGTENPILYGIKVYNGGGGVQYGLNLIHVNDGGYKWGTNIYGPNQSSRRIYFSKINTDNPSSMSSFDIKAYINLDNGDFISTGELYAKTSNKVWHGGNAGTTAYNWSAKSLILSGGISGATAIASTATLDINATNDIRLRAGARSLVLTSTYLKPYDVDHNTMSLGTSGARWSTIYGTSLNLNGTISGATTISASGAISAANGASNGMKFGTARITSVTGNDIISLGTSEFRLSDSSSWDYNAWGGFKFENSTKTMYIGGPAGTKFSSNSGPAKVTIDMTDASSGVEKLKVSALEATSISSTGSITATNIWNIITIKKSLTVTEAWMDTGILFDVATFPSGNGSYMISAYEYAYSVGGGYDVTYTGTCSIYTGGTNHGNYSEEIALHANGHAVRKRIYLRTMLVAGNTVGKLQIAASSSWTGASEITFKFKRLM